MINIIDPHIHFIDLFKGHYLWLRSENQPFWPDKSRLNLDVKAEDFLLNEPMRISGLVHIEAGFDNENPARELEFIQNMVGVDPHMPVKAVAFANLLSSPDVFQTQIKRLKSFELLQGIRFILDDRLHEIFSFPHIIENLEILISHNLHFELQADFTSRHTDKIIREVLHAVPELKIAVNHAGFIPLNKEATDYKNWFNAMCALNEIPNMFVKVSGLEMSRRTYSRGDMEFAIAQCVSIFTEDKVGIASNYPVMKLAANPALNYSQYWINVLSAINKLNLPLKKLVFSNTASFYQFNCSNI